MVPKHDGARPHKPGVSATVFPVKKEKPKLIPYQPVPYPCMLPKTWSTTGVLDRFSLPKDHWNYPIKREEQEPLPLPDYFYPITGKGTIQPGLRFVPSGNFFLALNRSHHLLLKKVRI